MVVMEFLHFLKETSTKDKLCNVLGVIDNVLLIIPVFQKMSLFCQKLAPYQFLTAFPQLISRICHAHPGVFQQLQVCILQPSCHSLAVVQDPF